MTIYETIDKKLERLEDTKCTAERKEILSFLLQQVEPLIRSLCRHYFGTLEEDRLQNGRLRSLELILGYDRHYPGVKFFGYMKRMLQCYFWQMKRSDLKESALLLTCDEMSFYSFESHEYHNVWIDDLLGRLTEKEEYLVREHVLKGKTLKQSGEELHISYSYAKELKRKSLQKLRKMVV